MSEIIPDIDAKIEKLSDKVSRQSTLSSANTRLIQDIDKFVKEMDKSVKTEQSRTSLVLKTLRNNTKEESHNESVRSEKAID